MAWILWLLHDYRSACIYHLWWFDIWAPAVIFLIEMAVLEFERRLGRSGRCILEDKLVGWPPKVASSIDSGWDLAKLRTVRTICVSQTWLFVSILSVLTVIQDFPNSTPIEECDDRAWPSFSGPSNHFAIFSYRMLGLRNYSLRLVTSKLQLAAPNRWLRRTSTFSLQSRNDFSCWAHLAFVGVFVINTG